MPSDWSLSRPGGVEIRQAVKARRRAFGHDVRPRRHLNGGIIFVYCGQATTTTTRLWVDHDVCGRATRDSHAISSTMVGRRPIRYCIVARSVTHCSRLRIHNYTIRYDSVYFKYLTCSKKLTGSQLSLPHEINKKLKCETKNKMMSVIGPVQSVIVRQSGR